MNDLKYGILINNAQKQFSERGFECMLAIVLVLGSLALLMFFPIMGVALSIFASCFLCVGTKKYLLSIARDQFLPVETIFYGFKVCIKAFCLKVASILISFLWGIIFIVPGIISALNYSMASFILAEDEKLSALECMAKSKKLVDGNRGEIFIIYLCYFFVSMVVLTIFGAIGLALRYYTVLPVWVPLICMLGLFLFVLIIFIIPYFELSLANVYLELVKAKKTKSATSGNGQTATKKKARTSTTKKVQLKEA